MKSEITFKGLKTTVCLIFVFCTVLMLCCGTAVYARNEYSATPLSMQIDNFAEIYEAMYEAIDEGEEYIELSDYNISTDDIFSIFYDLYLNSPEFFFLDNRIEFYYTNADNTEYVTRVYFLYSMNSEERKKAEAEYEKELAYIVSQVDAHMTDVEKALWVHDYFTASFEYDTDMTIYDAYHLLTQRKGICQAYALCYVAVMRELGIEAYTVSSSEMNHSWNIVNIDGEWYHVDIVFDDPTPDKKGSAQHDYFLLTDAEMKNAEHKHSGWTSRYLCTAKTYENAAWKSITSRMDYSSGKWYYIDTDKSALESCDFNLSDTEEEIFVFNEKWYIDNDETQYWIGVYSGVSVYDDKVYVNTPNEVLAIDIESGDESVIYKCKENETIYGSIIYKNVLEYNIADSPNSDDGQIRQIKITDSLPVYSETQIPFDDVSRLDKDYYAVKYVYANGLFNGVSENKFAPESSLTRAMFVTVLGRLCGVDTSLYTQTSYSDVQPGLWYSPYVEWARQIGLVNGVDKERFAPTNIITREQGYKIAASFCSIFGYGTDNAKDVDIEYGDKDSVSSWAINSVRYCIKNRIISKGNSSIMLEPNLPLTREEAASIVCKLALLTDLED